MKLIIIGIIFLMITVALALHQFIFWDVWFEIPDIHHESWMLMFGFSGLVLVLLGGYKK